MLAVELQAALPLHGDLDTDVLSELIRAALAELVVVVEGSLGQSHRYPPLACFRSLARQRARGRS